jgi:hypothetical protein
MFEHATAAHASGNGGGGQRKKRTRQHDKQNQTVAQLSMFRLLPTLAIKQIIVHQYDVFRHRHVSPSGRPPFALALSASLRPQDPLQAPQMQSDGQVLPTARLLLGCFPQGLLR